MFNFIYLYSSISSFFVIFLLYKHFTQRSVLHEQNSRLIGLYLDRKLIAKLLKTLVEVSSSDRMHCLIDEIISYFCLDFLALRVSNSENIVSFKNPSSKIHYLENQIKTKLDRTIEIVEEVGNKVIEDEKTDQQSFVFKYKELSIFTALEPKHKFNQIEIDTFEYEVMQILFISILLNKEIDKEVFMIAQ